MRGGEELAALIHAAEYQNWTECGILWAYREATGEIAGKLVGPNFPGVTPIRYNPKTDVYRSHWKGVFEENPAIVPSSARWAPLARRDEEGFGSFLFVNVSLAIPKPKGTKGSKSSGKKTDDKAAQPKAKAEATPAPTEKAETKAP